jgi:hypothetical protein
MFDDWLPVASVLVPSSGADAGAVRTALLSAALQEWPDLQIVLVIDDRAASSDFSPAAMVQATAALPDQINELLAGPGAIFARSLEAFESRVSPDYRPDGEEIRRVVATYQVAAAWLIQLIRDEERRGRADRYLADEVLQSLASDFGIVAADLQAMADSGATLSTDRIHRLYRRLAWTFGAHLSSFEDQEHPGTTEGASLDRYVGLIGGHYRTARVEGRPTLVSTRAGTAELSIPKPDFVLLVEPGSTVPPEYCMRLAHRQHQRQDRGGD